MGAGQQEANNNGKKARDAALTWDVPPPLEVEKVSVAGRAAFAAVEAKHLEALVQQLLQAEGVQDAGAWCPVICQLAQQAAGALSPTAAVAHGKLDPRFYIKVKRVLSPGAAPSDSNVVLGVACRKSLSHKRMRSSIQQPRIMLLAGGIELQRSLQRGSGAMAAIGAAASQLSSFDALLDQEQRYLAAAVDRIASYNPDVLLVERSVGRHAQELLLVKDISLVLNVKLELLERIARCTGALVAPSVDQLTSHCIGFCKEFEVESLGPGTSASTVSAAAVAAGAAVVAAHNSEVSPRTPDTPDGHIVADAATLRKAALGAGSTRALMCFRGCPRPLGSTILLRGGDPGELRRLKRVATFAAYAAYWGVLETAFLSDQLAAAATSVLPGSSQQPDMVAGMADAVASTSYLATAEARGRQAIVSASPHVSVLLERGVPSHELDLLPRAGEGQQGEQEEEDGEGSSGSGGDWEGAPDSPASSDSTNMWVLAAEAGSATFTVSGSQSQSELGIEGQQQQQLLSGDAAALPPGSPQDPLHLAAKELALQQLQLTGSEPPSPVAGASAAAGSASGAAGVGPAQPPSQQQQQQQVGSEVAGSNAGVAAQQALAEAAEAAELRRQVSNASASLAPGTLAYCSQQLWLAISCKNPAKGIACEPSHQHCMDFYADTDLPLAAFLSAAAPPNRKCPHPQCGEGAPLHLRSFMHANGLVTLSSVRLPAGKELPDGRVWLWLRPAGGRGGSAADVAAGGRRVALSPEAGCLSFAHLLSLLLDARLLSLGGLSLQRDFVRYLGCGSTLLCLHYSPATPYTVRMPARRVELLAERECDWLQEEIKQLTEEGDEAFGAIEYALVEQLRALEGADAEFHQMWLDTLAETRSSFLDMVQDTITLLNDPPNQSPHQHVHGGSDDGEAGQQLQQEEGWGACGDAVQVVWELNRLRSMLAAVVLQWATCLHEGSPGTYAAPPSGAAAALTSALQTRRAAAHSRHLSVEGHLPAAGGEEAGEEVVEAAEGDGDDALLASPLSGAAPSEEEEDEEEEEEHPELLQRQGQLQAGAAGGILPPSLPVPVAAGSRMRRTFSGKSLGRQFLEAAGSTVGMAPSESNYGAPSLREDDAAGSSSLGTSPNLGIPGGGSYAAPPSIPTGLVARYVSMFDPRGEQRSGGSGGGGVGGAGSLGTSPAGPGLWSQRTREWLQTASPAVSPTAADAEEQRRQQQQEEAEGAAEHGAREPSPAAAEASGSGSMAASPGAAAAPQQDAASAGAAAATAAEASRAQLQQQLRSHQLSSFETSSQDSDFSTRNARWGLRRPSFFRLDLTNPDPELVRALTPTHRSASDEAEVPLVRKPSRLEQIAARLGRMSLSKSFTERQRSFSQGQITPSSFSLDHSLEPSLEPSPMVQPQHLPTVEERSVQPPAAQPETALQEPSVLPEQQQQQQGVLQTEEEQQQQHAAAEESVVQQAAPQSPQRQQAAAEELPQHVLHEAGSGEGQQGMGTAVSGAAAAADEAAPAAGEGEGAVQAEGDQLLPPPEAEGAGEQLPSKGSASHFDEWKTLLADGEAAGAEAAGGEGAADASEAGPTTLMLLGGDEAASGAPGGSSGTGGAAMQMRKSSSAARLDAIGRLQEAPMPATLSGSLSQQQLVAPGAAAAAVAAAGAELSPAASAPMPVTAEPATSLTLAASAPITLPATRASSLPTMGNGPSSAVSASAPAGALPPPPTQSPPLPSLAPSHSHSQPEKQPNKLMQLLGKLRSELQPGHMPLTAGKVELSGRALLPGGADGMRVTIFDDEPTSIVAYFLATKEYQLYLHDAVATILFGDPNQRASGSTGLATAASGTVDGGSSAMGAPDMDQGAAAVPGSWQSLPDSPRSMGRRSSSLVPGLQHQAGRATAAAAAAAAAVVAGDVLSPEAAAAAAGVPPPPPSVRTVTQEALAAEQSGDWQVLFHEQQLDCQLSFEDPSPGMPWGRAKFQLTAYYAPQFAELRRRCVAGGDPAFLASISRCRKWASRGGKSSVYFARSCDKRYIIKQLSRSERQSFLEFAPDYFRYLATMLHRGQDTCLAKILGMYQVSVQYTGGRGAPTAPPFGSGKEGAMDLLVMENVFYGRDAQVARIYDLKGSQRDRYAADNPSTAGAVLLDENLKELNLSSPTLVGPCAFARLQRALWSDTSFLSGLGVMDYSLLVGVDKERQELVVGVIDYIRQYTWDKQVETWVKKSGILGGAGKDPTVISPKQYSRRFRIAMSSYLTVVPSWHPPEPPLDPDAM